MWRKKRDFPFSRIFKFGRARACYFNIAESEYFCLSELAVFVRSRTRAERISKNGSLVTGQNRSTQMSSSDDPSKKLPPPAGSPQSTNDAVAALKAMRAARKKANPPKQTMRGPGDIPVPPPMPQPTNQDVSRISGKSDARVSGASSRTSGRISSASTLPPAPPAVKDFDGNRVSGASSRPSSKSKFGGDIPPPPPAFKARGSVGGAVPPRVSGAMPPPPPGGLGQYDLFFMIVHLKLYSNVFFGEKSLENSDTKKTP